MSLTYDEVGGTLQREMPAGYHHVEVARRVGDAGDFAAVADFVVGWGLQRSAGVRVPAPGPAVPGLRVEMRLGAGPLALRVPVEVVRVLDEPDRRGFAYGTLLGHPERGEELFAVERRADGTWLRIRAFSRPGRWFTRAAGPAGRLAQVAITRRYLAAGGRWRSIRSGEPA